MPSSGIIDVAIGLIFVFGVTAVLASVITELIARFLGLRGAYLLGGMRALLDGGHVSTDLSQATADYHDVKKMMLDPAAPPMDSGRPPSATGALLGGPILGSQGMAGQISDRSLTLTSSGPAGRPSRLSRMTAAGGPWRRWSECRSLPSYISAQSFAEAVIDLVVPDAAGQTTMTTIQHNINALPDAMSLLRSSLQALAKNADGDVTRFRTAVERWYGDHMDRVSGWYKRHVARITLVAGAILVLVFNINALTIGRTLYTESTVSTAVSTVAAKGTSCPSNFSREACLAQLQAELSAVATAGLPIGWGTVRDCNEPGAQCDWLDQRGIFSRHGGSGGELVLVLVGFLIMIIAMVPGARFWFDLLGRLGSLRSTGPKPSATGS